MDLASLLRSVPPTEWRTRRAIVFDWSDGPREGVCALAHPAGEFVFELAAERTNPDGPDDRLFFVSELPTGTVDELATALTELGDPGAGVWVPVWRFADPTHQQAAEQLVETLLVAKRPAPLVIRTPDMEHFEGCWPTPDNGAVSDAAWFALVERP